MCVPAVIAAATGAVSIGTTVGGSIVQGEAQGKQAAAEQEQALFAASQEHRNAELARQQAVDVTNIGIREAGRTEAAGRLAGASAATKMAASGLDVTSGSAANLIATSTANAAADAARLRANAAKQAWGFEQEAQQHLDQEQQYLRSEKYIKQAGYLGTLGTGLQGVGQGVSALGSTVRSIYGAA